MSLKPHEILGLPENYNLSDAKSAFYAFSRQYHPDTTNCNFLSKEEKQNIFIVIEEAYKKILEENNFGEMDAPMFTVFNYETDIIIDRNENLNSLSKFNEEFERVHSEENYDNPWSIYYNFPCNEANNTKLDILRPEEFRNKYYYEYGVNNCKSFTRPNQYNDIYHTDENLDNVKIEEKSIDILLEEREKNEYDPNINAKEENKKKILKVLENEKRKIQLERDLRILKLN